MRPAAVVFALLAACRGDQPASRAEVVRHGNGAVAALVPTLPPSPDPVAEVRAIDERILRLREQPREVGTLVATLLERATIRGELEDYQEVLARSARWVEDAPRDQAAWRAHVQVLARVHRFAEARTALEQVKKLANDPSEWQELSASLDEATGQLERSQPVRDELARIAPSTMHLVQRAGGLAAAGELDDALAIMPGAAAALHDNAPELMSWLLFQWGRLYEQKGEPAAARDFYAAARDRLPTLEITAHLAQSMVASGDATAASAVVDAALVDQRHPELLGLAVQLGHGELAAEAAEAWERYLLALPEAFADHAARFYLGAGNNAPRALELARKNLANRDTHEARALVVEAALAAGDASTACAAAAPLGRGGTRAQRFAAWRALSACGRKDDADRLAHELGITH
jgi:tetratricopeptide (TPR) repeat protein